MTSSLVSSLVQKFTGHSLIVLAQQWSDVEVIDLGSCSRGAKKGRRPQTVTLLFSWVSDPTANPVLNDRMNYCVLFLALWLSLYRRLGTLSVILSLCLVLFK